ncbi:MAG: ABC-2 family transporter protein [Thermomicrobiales bacterium]|nr:ABC-2 family transporter protein [Thermomicrobiales bacterium]
MSAESPDVTKPSPRALLDLYRGEMSVMLAWNLQYRGAVFLWVLGAVMQPLVLIVVWQAVADGRDTGMTAGEYAAYFMVSMIVSHMTFIWHMWEFEWRIRSGYFSPLLLRPVHPIHADVCQSLAYKLVGLAGIIPAAILMAVIFRADFGNASWQSVMAFLPALLLAMALRFIVEWCLALAAFWMTKVASLNQLFDAFFLFLGGQFAPISVMPDWIQTLSFVLPFRWSIYFPIQVALGNITGADLWIGFGMQIAWIALAVAVLQLMWKRAVANYSAVGA